VRAHIDNRRESVGRGFGFFYQAWLSENNRDSITGGKNPASTIQDYAPARPLGIARLLLLEAPGVVIVALEVLQIEAPAGQRHERCDKQRRKGNQIKLTVSNFQWSSRCEMAAGFIRLSNCSCFCQSSCFS